MCACLTRQRLQLNSAKCMAEISNLMDSFFMQIVPFRGQEVEGQGHQ